LLAALCRCGAGVLFQAARAEFTLYDDYDHLARRKEWADEKADE
jgi:hypothetical protein